MSNCHLPDEAVQAVARLFREEHSGGSQIELHPALEAGAQKRAERFARAALEAALPALRARRVELGAVYGYELGRSDIAGEIAQAIEKRRDSCVEGSAAWRKYDEAMQIARQMGAKP